MDMEFINILAGMDKERAEKHSKKYLDLMLQHGWKKGGDKIVKLEYMRWAQEEAVKESYKRLEDIVKVKDTNVRPINELTDMFENILVEDLIKFKFLFPQHAVPVVLSETLRTKEDQANILLQKWIVGMLTKTYKRPLYYILEEKNYSAETLAKAIEQCKNDAKLIKAVETFFAEPSDKNAWEIFYLTASSDHMRGNAVDITGLTQYHSHDMKKDLVEFLNTRNRYTIFLYINNIAAYTAEKGAYFLYGKRDTKSANKKTKDEVFNDLVRDTNWFFHVQRSETN